MLPTALGSRGDLEYVHVRKVGLGEKNADAGDTKLHVGTDNIVSPNQVFFANDQWPILDLERSCGICGICTP